MAKRKRSEAANGGPDAKSDSATKKPRAEPAAAAAAPTTVAVAKTTTDLATTPFAIQVITGSYDRILHGIIASVEPDNKVSVADTFLFNAHTTAIRCLAISEPSAPIPGQSQKVFLVSGSTDEKINVYNLSAHPPTRRGPDPLAGITPRPVLENPKNRELGTLHHHSSTVTALSFPTRGKLLSASEDSTIAVTRTRDWALLSTIKVPLAQAKGRPSGDTASYSSLPSGANDFAVHPSLKTMISVSRGERCMRLWNLVTGKKAGVLNFGRELLADVGEGRHATGEGRKVVWGGKEGEEEFAVAFDRDVAVFGVDAVARCRVMGAIKTKVHKIRYVSLNNDDDEEKSGLDLLAVSTEDGRILFFSTRTEDLVQPEEKEESGASSGKGRAGDERLPSAKLVASLGGQEAGVTSRIKDFTILRRAEEGGAENFYVVGGSSDGKIRIWRVARDALVQAAVGGGKQKKNKGGPKDTSVGELLCTYGTQNRITCLEAFIMIPRPEGVEESEDEEEDWEDEGSDDDEEDDE